MNTGAGLASYYRQLTTRLHRARSAERKHVSVDDEAPLRSELFSADQMELHGKALAAAHRLAPGHSPDQLLARLADNEIVLTGVCKLLAAAVTARLPVTPAGEWLLDNFYLIEEQIRTARRHLPKGYSRELPRLDHALSGALAATEGRPRVYDMALEIISHGDGRVDMDVLCRFVAAYQSVTALKLGELWATPIMLRLAVIENLRRVAARVAAGRSDRNIANIWADRMMETAESEPNNLILVIADMARSSPPMSSAFVAEVARRLQGRGPALVLPLTWMEQRLAESGLTIEQSVQLENQQQAADQVSISNSIGSLRVLGATDWRDFVERMSLVEKTLLADPGGYYGRMDFATRDRYRHATERIAKETLLAEDEVARKAVELAAVEAQRGVGDGERRAHVGYYLIDAGLAQLEAAAEVRRSLLDSLRRYAARHALLLYLAPIGLLTAIVAALLLAQAEEAWPAAEASFAFSVLGQTLLGGLALLAASQLAVALVNWLATLWVQPRALPSMDYSKGIAAPSRTLVVVPTMLSSAANVERLIEALEVRFLGNRDANLYFGLLTDLVDADQPSLPGDEVLVDQARAGIDGLNEKYGDAGDRSARQHFFLFHRARSWNPVEGRWMGYERKRGKLAALNALLRPGTEDGGNGFALVVGDVASLAAVKYVITLDTDTQLPRDSARQFVGAMAHPLNRPLYDAARQRVVDGYGILQPRVAISLPGTNRSHYARLYGGEPGIDPYTRAVSDVYQDVFGEGSFVGKGIYDVDAFEQAIGGRFPENLILSHDLLEGCYARAGLLSNVNLYEDYPARYGDDVGRRFRWLRGDWQLTGWLRRSVPCAPSGQARAAEAAPLARSANPLSLLAQWKLFDNLRRSLVPLALTLLLIGGWSVLPSLSAVGLWTLSVLAVLLLPRLCARLVELLRKPSEVLPRQHFSAVAQSVARDCAQFLFELACLPYEAYFSLCAIVRTVWRMHVTHRRLLEWNASSAADDDACSGNEFVVAARAMWIAPLIALALAIGLALSSPAALVVAGPILLLWLASPLIAGWMSRSLVPRRADLTPAQNVFLHTLARRIWAFFEKYVAAEDHWLPPDNCQEYRVSVVAHRTSPTNIGMALLANLSAYDFGYLTAGQVATRTALTLRTLEQLERYRGHFYNWYDTLTLQPLSPLYVSTVDSGNLAGHLLTLRAGLLALRDDSILPERWFSGLGDTLYLLEPLLADEAEPGVKGAFAALRKALDPAQEQPARTLVALRRQLEQLATSADDLVGRLALRVRSPERTMASSNADADAGPAVAAAANAVDEAGDWARALAGQCRAAVDELSLLAPGDASAAPESIDGGITGLPTLRELAEAGSAAARDRLAIVEGLAQQAGELAQMDYEFLYDKTRRLLAIGYNVGECRLDAGYYDLLASEARLSCFVAIAQGQVPQDIWFALGRLLTRTSGDAVLLSWSGSMFEYLMPLLVMPTYDNTLLDQTCKAAVARQIEYGRQRGVAWGISESGYNTVDAHLNYQYRAFGVPGLGLKRGLSDDLVVAPYASVLALMVAPEAACLNLQRLAADGFLGRYGFFEAIDYTPARQRRRQTYAVVRSFMAHHQGMSLLALAYLLRDRPMQRRFAADRQLQSVLPLLQERIPKAMSLFSHTAILSEIRTPAAVAEMPIRVFTRADTPIPEVQLLSNGRYHVMVTNAGGGYSRWKDLAVTRWREDATRDNWGSFCYIRELTAAAANAGFWSSAYQPTRQQAESYEAIFSEGRAEFRRRDAVSGGAGSAEGYFETHTEIVVSPEDDIELRRVRITNRSRQARSIEVTSYAEVVIASVAEDALHPAFSNLFVHTEIVRERGAILATRRPRSQGEQAPWMLHLVAVHGAEVGAVSYETDRARFIGRGRSLATPLAMSVGGALSGTDGSVLDPIVAIRQTVTVAANQSVTVDIVSGIAETREGALSLVDKYQDRRLTDRVLDLAWTHSQVVLRQLSASEADAQLYVRLASSVIFANAALRAEAAVLSKNRRGQSGLWGYAISGDLPIVLLQIADGEHIALVRQLVQAHAYWRLKGLAVDVVIWNEDHAGYRQQLQDQIIGLIASGIEASVIDRPGGIFVRSAEQISSEDRILFQSVARAVISDSRGSLEEQLEDRRLSELLAPRLIPSRALRRARTLASGASAESPAGQPGKTLQLFNGIGGYNADGSEYVIELPPEVVTPAPWVNVLANAHFGTVISENGSAYTWRENAHEYRLTPWHNDPVSDAGGEAIYLRDEETGAFWSPTPLPKRAAASYVVRHGFGYSVFETRLDGIISELWVYVALDAAVKFSVLKIRNESGRQRRLSATGYVEWVLGDLSAKSAMHITSELDVRSGTLYARNQYSTEFSDRQAFFDVDDRLRTVTCDRREFIGRNGSLTDPAAMRRSRLSGRVGTGYDPCAAIQVVFDLANGGEREIVFRLGAGRNADDAGKLAQRLRGAVAARAELDAVRQYWAHTLAAVRIETPDPSLNVLTNGWLVYQTLACRLWARSAYYQSGGAFGFRDQLQDVMALVHATPGLAREHLLLCASRQFAEGDVQHWWHPPSGRGVRTHCSDDYLWLPLAACRYVKTSGDSGVLDERVSFLDGRPVNPEDDSYYDLPAHSAETASLYEHCVRAIRHGLRFGGHGLPLIGSGDWNDGMNLVGSAGKGESVWLGFFLYDVLRQFSALATAYGDPLFAELCVEQAVLLRRNIEQNAWDGAWYRRAYFDDGTPLGSASNVECRIDSIAQSWSVLSGAAEEKRSRLAMQAVDDHLVRRDESLVQLLDPPFSSSSLNPGYIRGYVPGVRENGGQYTHAAIWATMAFAALGERDRAWELFNMINPVNHALTPAATAIYKVEPYVVAADVYALAPHTGRGGWSWYTGSAGWMYRLILESLLGLKLEGDSLRLAPCLPADWKNCTIHYRYRETTYLLAIAQTADGGAGAVVRVTVDGVESEDNSIALVDDRQAHRVDVVVGGG